MKGRLLGQVWSQYNQNCKRQSADTVVIIGRHRCTSTVNSIWLCKSWLQMQEVKHQTTTVNAHRPVSVQAHCRHQGGVQYWMGIGQRCWDDRYQSNCYVTLVGPVMNLVNFLVLLLYITNTQNHTIPNAAANKESQEGVTALLHVTSNADQLPKFYHSFRHHRF